MLQTTMDQIVHRVICVVDDILVTGETEAEHLDNLKVLHLHEHGIRTKKSKCVFLRSSVLNLGHRIDADGIHPVDTKLKIIKRQSYT